MLPLPLGHASQRGGSPTPHRQRWAAHAPTRLALALAPLLVIGLLNTSTRARGEEIEGEVNTTPGLLSIAERTIVQDQGSWLVEYRLRYEGPTLTISSPNEVRVKVEGWVSNSRVASHTNPRLSTLTLPSQAGWTRSSEVIASNDENQRCRERLTLQFWDGDRPDSPLVLDGSEAGETSTAPGSPGIPSQDPPALLSLHSGVILRARLRFEHLHSLYGSYDPLLSQRALELQLGEAVLFDLLPMDQEQYLALPSSTMGPFPEERLDTEHFLSAPDSLHLEAHISGHESYRLPEQPVRYSTKMRLTFWYLIAAGTEGGCHVRISQFKDTPTMYRPLHDSAQEIPLTRVGRWVKVERVFRTAAEATTLAVEFKIRDPGDTRVGEVWIDDIQLEPVVALSAHP